MNQEDINELLTRYPSPEARINYEERLAEERTMSEREASAILEHEQYKAGLQAEMNQARAEAKARWEQTGQAKAEAAARAQLAALDNLMKKAVVDECHKFLEGLATPAFNLPENASDHCDLISRFKSMLDCYENGGHGR